MSAQPPTTNALNKPDTALLERFSNIVGESNALRAPDAQAPHLVEWRERYRGRTPLVLKPATVDEVSQIVRLANQHRIGLVAQSGNTGLVGGQIPRPEAHDIVVSLSRLNRVREVRPQARTMIVDAGLTLHAAQIAAEDAGLMFPLRMASEGSACIGGAIATNAGGVHVLSYGTTRALTLGLEAVFANGDVWEGLRTLKKDNTGYNLKDLLIGSEGTLAIITGAALKLTTPPKSTATAMLAVNSLEAVGEIFRGLTGQLGASLTAFEFMSAQSLAFVTDHIETTRLPFAEPWPWALLIEVSSGHATNDAQGWLESALSQDQVLCHIRDSALANSKSQANAFWQLRELISEAQKFGGGSIKHDISVPIESIPDFITRANALIEQLCPGARPCPFGHFGDGNIHYNVSQPVDGDKQTFLDQWETMQDRVHALVTEMNGSISAEHGIGVMKRDALRDVKSATELNAMRAIKVALDPNGILNPGKVL